MDIFQNPFYLLGATPRDNTHRILELAEERSLLSDPDVCAAAGKTLAHPRDRVAAEVAWLVGVDPVRSTEVLRQLDAPDRNLLNVSGLTPIARANLLTSGLSRLSHLPSSNIVEWILAIAQSSEAINPETVCATLNADRRVFGFPEITNLSTINEEIQKQKSYYSQVLTSALKNLAIIQQASVLTQAVEGATGNGKSICPILIEDLILSYELGAQDSLEQKRKIIEAQDEQLRVMVDIGNPDATLRPIVNQLIQTVKEWDTLAQPIQLISKSRGERHTDSIEIAWQIRELAIHLFNEYSKLDFSRQITNMLKEVFAEVPEIAEQIAGDLIKLEEQAHLAKSMEKFEEVNTQVEKLKTAADARQPDYTLSPMVNQLIQSVKSWDTTQSVDANSGVAFTVREVALHLCNEHRKLDFAIQITNALIEVFNASRVGVEAMTRLAEDKTTLIGMKSFEEINTQVENLKAAADAKQPDHTLTPLVNQLIQSVKSWDTTTQTVDANNAVAIIVRNIALHLWNNHEELDFAIQITNALIGAFQGVHGMDEVNNQLSQDRTTLSAMNIQRRQVIEQPSKDGWMGCVWIIVIFIVLAIIGALSEGC